MERGVLVQRSMGPRLIIVGSVRTYDSAQVRLTEYDHVVQAFSADRANEPLNVSVLPGDRNAIGRSRILCVPKTSSGYTCPLHNCPPLPDPRWAITGKMIFMIDALGLCPLKLNVPPMVTFRQAAIDS
jgi:hypothetical protein